MTGDQYLLLPGPTPIPERVTRAMSQPMVNHRGPEFKQVLTEVVQGLTQVYRTCLLYTSFRSVMPGECS